MHAIQIASYDGPDKVEYTEVPTPEAGPDQVLIRVRAAGVSFPELLQTRGRQDPLYRVASGTRK